MRLLIRALIGIVQTSAVSHPHEASNKVFNKDASEGGGITIRIAMSAVRHSSKDCQRDSNKDCPRERCEAFW